MLLSRWRSSGRIGACLLAFCSAGAGANLISGVDVRLQTRTSSLVFNAGSAAPKIVSLGAGDGRNWTSMETEALITSAVVGGRATPLHWRFLSEASRVEAARVAFVYQSDSPLLRLTWWWEARASFGPIEHGIDIQNLTRQEIWIPLQSSLRVRFLVPARAELELFSVEKGSGKPSDAGTHLDPLEVGGQWGGESSTYAHSAPGEPREIIPFFAVRNAQGQLPGWYAGLEFSGRTRLSLTRDTEALSASAGLNPDPGPFRTRLEPGATFRSPVIFVGAFAGDLDDLGNVLRPWIRAVLGNPESWRQPSYPFLVNNSWGSGMEVDEKLARQMIRDSAELGLEMFHLDAGWFRGVGDWYPDPKKFPHGLAALSDFAHAAHLRFGLWVDWTQAGLDQESGALNLLSPRVRDWTVSNLPADWRPQPFKGQTIDLGVREAQAYAEREVLRIVQDYRLDMLEHDGYLVAQGCVRDTHPHAPPDAAHMSVVTSDGSYLVESSNSTDVSYHSVRAYYEIYAKLRKLHPNVLLEICNDGGRMVDFGSAAHGDYFSVTDTYDPIANRRAFYDASHLLPAAMLEAYVAKWPVRRLENFRYMLRSGMLGWLTIMQDTTAWTKEEHSAAQQEFALYKSRLRPLIRDASLYHVAPRPDGVHWDGFEYFDSNARRGVLYAFRGSTETESRHAFPLRGLNPAKTYRLHFQDRGGSGQTATGRNLAAPGLRVELPVAESSELIWIEEISR